MKKRSRRKFRVDVSLTETPSPVFLLDANRRIVFFNAGCEALTGWTSADVVGTVCEYQSEESAGTVGALAATLCPPPELLTGEPAVAAANLLHRDGTSRARILNFFPLLDADGNVETVLGVAIAIEKPLPPARVSIAQQLHAELAALRTALRQRYNRGSFLGTCDAMQRVLRQIDLAAGSQYAVLLRGETGSGKEQSARAIHDAGEQRTRSFVPIDCRNLPGRDVKGILHRVFDPESESAPGLQPATLFLTDVECLPRDIQELFVERFAANDGADSRGIRLIAATTCDVVSRVEADEIRADFFHLISTLEVTLPPLRERTDEIPLLAQAFLEGANRGADRQVGGFAAAVLDQFQEYRWPGNLTELRAVVTEAFATCSTPLIESTDLPFRFRTGIDAQAVGPRIRSSIGPLAAYLADIETERIRAALEETRHNKTLAAKLLGLTRARLYRRMETLEIEDREP